jgi:hypothetical protein
MTTENFKFFLLLLFEATFTSLLKDKKSYRGHKSVGIKVFLPFLLDYRRIPDPDPGGPKTNGSYGSGSGSATLVKRIK